MTDTDVGPDGPATMPTVEHHLVRGALWGLSLGIGLAIYAVIFRVITLHLATMGLIVAVGVAVGVLWSRFGPAKG